MPETVRLIYDLNKAGFALPISSLNEDDCARAVAEMIR